MPEERFDIYDESMNHLGTAARSEAHKHGYWHRTFHCWLLRHEDDRLLVRFQRRQLTKDTNPGCYDTTAAGHLAAGETMRDAARELEEELGVKVRFEELIPLMQVREDVSGIADGELFIDREVSDVFGLVSNLPLSEFKLQREEVYGIYEAELADMLALFRGELEYVEADGAELSEAGDGLTPCVRKVLAKEFVTRDNSYYIDAMLGLRDMQNRAEK